MAVDINIGSKLDTKGFKQAETALDKLNKGGKSLARTLGYAFGTAAILRYGKNAARAFAEDEKAAKALTLTLNNLGMAFADPEVKRFIASLESQFGVLDDLLRPAYQKLLTTTGDYKKAQDLLKTSLDLSAMSGSDVVSVSNDIAKAYAGNTRGLIKYGLGLSKTELAAMSFEDILKQIAIVSEGQAQTAADSYAGSLDRLNVAVKNASESIGKDLFNALDTVAGGGGLPKTINLIESLSSGVGDALIGIARLARNISILASGNPLESIRDLQKATQKDRLADMKERASFGGIYADIYKAEAASNAAQKKALATSKAITKQTAAQLAAAKLKTAIDKANLALNKGSDVFDIEKIQLKAAEISQAQQLGKVTSQAQLLQITNDLARLRVKQDILALDAAIASGDVKAITAATAKLNADLGSLSALTGQAVKLADIKSILNSIAPKELIDIKNLNEAIRLLGIIKGAPVTATSSSTMSKAPIMPSSLNGMPVGRGPIGGNRANAGLTNQELQYFEDLANYQSADLFANGANPFATSGSSGGSAPISITVNTGVGDPNAIAEAINQVLTNAQQRGTLRAYAIA
jgi:hypothetical protein